MAYAIPADNWAKLLERIEKLTRRAKKLGRLVPTLTKVGEHDEVVDAKRGISRTFYDVELVSEPVAVAGWDFVATVELGDSEVGLVINRVPGVLDGVDIPAEYRKTTNYCSHCQKAVRRNNVYVLHNSQSGSWQQVGRNCLGQFLGGIDPEDVVRQMELVINIDALCTGAQGSDYFGLGGTSDYLDLQSTLVFTGFVIRQLGWLSRTKARELSEDGRSVRATADVIADAYFTMESYKSQEAKDVIRAFDAVSDADKATLEMQAEAAVEWIRSTSEDDRNDYLHNLYVCCSSSSFNRKHLGIVASLLVAHQNTMGRLEKLKAEAAGRKASEHFGEVGKRQTFQLLVKDIKFWSNNFGTTMAIFFEDANGNRAIWKSSREVDVEIGSTYEIAGKVKNHSDYKGMKQTELSHCKISGAIGGF